jgi:hypothetical protein
MKGWLIAIVVIGLGGYLWYAKPWEPARYDQSAQGKQAKAIDKRVEQAKAFRNPGPDTWEARDYVKPTGNKRDLRDYGFGEREEAEKQIEALYAAGAKDVSYIHVVRRAREGQMPEGLYVALPDDKSKRAALIAIAQKWKYPPKECNQKYLYYSINSEEWNPDKPETSFMGTD